MKTESLQPTQCFFGSFFNALDAERFGKSPCHRKDDWLKDGSSQSLIVWAGMNISLNCVREKTKSRDKQDDLIGVCCIAFQRPGNFKKQTSKGAWFGAEGKKPVDAKSSISSATAAAKLIDWPRTTTSNLSSSFWNLAFRPNEKTIAPHNACSARPRFGHAPYPFTKGSITCP